MNVKCKKVLNYYEKVNDVHIEPYKSHYRELKIEYHCITQQKSRCYEHCVISSMSYMYLKVGMTHFYRLALYNLVLGLTNILLKSRLFK